MTISQRYFDRPELYAAHGCGIFGGATNSDMNCDALGNRYRRPRHAIIENVVVKGDVKDSWKTPPTEVEEKGTSIYRRSC